MESLEDKDTFRRMARSQSNVLRHDFHTCHYVLKKQGKQNGMSPTSAK